jgi:hypothetical protein
VSVRVPAVVAAKWAPEVLDEGFVPFPKRLIRTLARIFRGEHGVANLAVVLAIVDYRRDTPVREPSIGYLAFNAGLTTEEFRERLADLHEQGLIDFWGSDEALRVEIKGLVRTIVRESSGEA